MNQLTLDEKHSLYEASVQNAEFEVEFMINNYEQFYGVKPVTLREDFCGTAAVCCNWVKQGPQMKAIGIDLDPGAIEYGKKRHLTKLTASQRERVLYVKENVLNAESYKADVVAAFNFSYMIFKKRSELLAYFKTVRKSLNEKGVFFIDLLGGPDSQTLVEEETEHDDFSYFWDCDKFNPITNECLFHIHFKYKGIKHEKVFTYDWRLWSIPELRELLAEAGFSKSFAFWEGDDDEGGGDSDFRITDEADNCDSWVTYLAAMP